MSNVRVGRNAVIVAAVLLAVLSAARAIQGEPQKYLSHPPMRPLPAAYDRPMGDGPGWFVDAGKGDDAQDGSKEKPWKTVGRGLKGLKPGDTLYLRGGVYYETVILSLAGERGKPITIRAYPNELVIIDGGLREFFENPSAAWEPAPDGAEGEFRSTKTYPDMGGAGYGNFGDSMVPLNCYMTLNDFRSKNEYWNKGLSNRQDDPVGIYLGPGLWYMKETQRFHVRLSHTNLAALGGDNYRGETDPRKVPLVIGGSRTPFQIEGARRLAVQDIVVRGTSRLGASIAGSEDITLDNVTMYGGYSTLNIKGTWGLRLLNSALRGRAAPWSSRGGQKDRGMSGYLLVTAPGIPDNQEVEIAYCEFTDHHDGLLLYGVRSLKLHHSLVDNFNDDGIEVGPKQKHRCIQVYQNWISRCLLTFALHGSQRPGEAVENLPGSGVYIYRNVIDLRGRTRSGPPAGPDAGPGAGLGTSVLCSDHGSPIWPVYYFYHNTVLEGASPWRGYYASGMGARGTTGNRRWVFNNIFATMEGLPGMNIAAGQGYQMDGNLHWGVKEGPKQAGDFFEKFRKSKLFEESKKWYGPGWTARDVFADPKFAGLNAAWGGVSDLTLQKDSPAVDAGVQIPMEWVEWPDPLRESDKDAPDIGAIPLGVEPWTVGVRGRFGLSGEMR